MSIPNTFKTILAQAFTTNVTHMSLHTADPGTTGANDSAVAHKALTWTGPTNGVATVSATYTALTGNYTHVGLWAGATFRQGITCPISYAAAADVIVTVTHEVDQ
jgi:hypothetical protein